MKISFYKFLFFKKVSADSCPGMDIRQLCLGICLLSFLSCLFMPLSCGAEKEVAFSGRTMGTTYHIKVVTGYFTRKSGLQDKIDARLEAINQSMSTYIQDSEISRFNRFIDIDASFPVGDDFFHVIQRAQQLYTLTGGAWDGTIKPLVDLWGFGEPKRPNRVPDDNTIQDLLKTVGFDRIRVSDERHIQKKHRAITLDFASIAKGYAVDQVSSVLKAEGIRDFIVEIGGEVFAAGVRKDGNKWRVGVNVPDKDAALQDLYRVAQLSNRAMATSGDYRNFFEQNGVMYSHIIDPRTGYPVQNRVAGVTIIAPDCTMADGLATAVVVMGREKGMALVEQLPGVEGLIIVRDHDGSLRDFPSTGFALHSE
jgi:thiamine biosynthesis lipoprotein